MKDISGGVVHELPDDLGMRLAADARVLLEDIAPLARNEWICWTTAVKLVETKNEHAGGYRLSRRKACGVRVVSSAAFTPARSGRAMWLEPGR